MSVITRMRKQTAVWWRRLEPDKYGRFDYDEPVEIRCRWDDGFSEYINEGGETQGARAVAYVDRIMSVGDRLMRGELQSDTPDDPLTITDAFEIKRFDQNPNFKGTETLLTAYLGHGPGAIS